MEDKKKHPLGHLDDLFKSISDFSSRVDSHVNKLTKSPIQEQSLSQSTTKKTTFEPSLLDLMEKKQLENESKSEQLAVQKTLEILKRKETEKQQE